MGLCRVRGLGFRILGFDGFHTGFGVWGVG